MTHPTLPSTRYPVLFLSLFILLSAAPSASAQEYKEAFNAGLEAMKTYQASKDVANLDQAYSEFESCATLAQAAGDADVAGKANKYLSRIDYTRGMTAYKAGQYEEALAHHDKGIAHDASYDKHHYAKGLAFKKLDRMEEAIASFQQAMGSREAKTSRAATNAIRDHFIYLASSALSRRGQTPTPADGNEAMQHLQAMQEYVEPDADAYYYMAEAHKAKGDFQLAVDHANKALDLHTGSRTDKAKIYFTKAEALMFLGNNQAAREAFQNASYGSYKPSAQHFLEQLGGGTP